MERLQNSLLEYAWGSRTALAELLGRPSPSPRPQAEMWIGAHPTAPSRLASSGCTLAERIAAAPAAELGEAVCRRFEGRLPFLLKILAVDVPLSLQAHPDLEQARRGYDREETAGVPLSAPWRSYKDANHKPELLCALGPFDALCGFRRSSDTLALLGMLGAASLDPIAGLLRKSPGPGGVRAAFEQIMAVRPDHRSRFLADVLAACRKALETPGSYRAELQWTVELAAQYPHDMGVAASLLLNLVHLEAGQALFLPPGNLHTYLHGIGVELMASSDNVLRGGLTPKHVDVAELLRVLDFRDGPCVPIATRTSGGEREYLTPTADFRLGVIEIRGNQVCTPPRRGPELLLCIEGTAHATTGGGEPVTIGRGESVFVSASEAGYSLTGDAVVIRATAGDIDETREAATDAAGAQAMGRSSKDKRGDMA